MFSIANKWNTSTYNFILNDWVCWHFKGLWWQIKKTTLLGSHTLHHARYVGTFLSHSISACLGPVAEAAVLRSALRWKRVDLFLRVIMYLSRSEQRLVFLQPLAHAEIWEEETDFSLCWLNRIWREGRLKKNLKIWPFLNVLICWKVHGSASSYAASYKLCWVTDPGCGHTMNTYIKTWLSDTSYLSHVLCFVCPWVRTAPWWKRARCIWLWTLWSAPSVLSSDVWRPLGLECRLALGRCGTEFNHITIRPVLCGCERRFTLHAIVTVAASREML